MDARLPALADQLLLIERELRVLGMWSSESPSAEALRSCCDSLTDGLATHGHDFTPGGI